MTNFKIKSIAGLSICLCCVLLSGCVSAPKDFMKAEENFMAERQLESRRYDTSDVTKITAAVVGVLQDMAFTIDESETQLGFVAASSEADATNPGQIATALALDITAAIFGAAPNSTGQCDKRQIMKVSVIARPANDGGATIVRANFQRIVWNMQNQISRVETVEDEIVYQKFFDGLSKSIFLEAHSI